MDKKLLFLARLQGGQALRIGRLIAVFLMCYMFFLPVQVKAQNVFVNEQTGYIAVIEDDADLLTQSEENELKGVMQEITVYGHVAFKTLSENYTSTASYASEYCIDMFGTKSGTVFIIDMANREIYIYSIGSVYQTITSAYANTITDNVYRYASDAEYYQCAKNAFEQELALLQGKKIAQPMKHISNLFLALIPALLINYWLVRKTSTTSKAEQTELLDGLNYHRTFNHVQAILTGTTKEYSPANSGGGRSSGGGGGGGGGSSGGGGGHGF